MSITVKAKQRNSNFELLRIISILLIIISHISWHGFAEEKTVYTWINNDFNRFILRCFNFGNLGVDLFIMISGYFLISSNFCINHIFQKVFKLIGVTFFYSIIIYFSYIYFSNKTITFLEIRNAIFPILYEANWFISAYIILYLISPLINQGLKENKKTHKYILLLSIIFWVIPHTFMMTEFFADEIPQFIMLYILGAYIKLYGKELNKQIINIILIIAIMIWILLPIFAELVNNQYIENHITYFYARNSLITICISFCTLHFFHSSKKNFYNKKINTLASYTLAIYLISDNYYIRNYIYSYFFDCKAFGENIYLIFIIILWTSLIYITCICIEYIRQLLMRSFSPNTQILTKKITSFILR